MTIGVDDPTYTDELLAIATKYDELALHARFGEPQTEQGVYLQLFDVYTALARVSHRVDVERTSRRRLVYAVLSLVEMLKARAYGVGRESDDPKYLAQLVDVLMAQTGQEATTAVQP